MGVFSQTLQANKLLFILRLYVVCSDLDKLDTVALPDNFCIIESRTTVQVSLHGTLNASLLYLSDSDSAKSSVFQNFAALGVDELQESIESRRNRIFLLMEEVRRGSP